MRRQHDLFGAPPRRPPRVLMHVRDAGLAPDGRNVAFFVCDQCGRKDWFYIETVSGAKRGIPCKVCNES